MARTSKSRSEGDVGAAFARGETCKRRRCETDGSAVYLHGNKIAWRDELGMVWLSMCGRDTVTTRDRLKALARIVITDAAVRVQDQTGYRPFLTTHDSLDYLVPASDAAAFDALLGREFAARPAWAPDLPLASEGGWGCTLAAAERMEND